MRRLLYPILCTGLWAATFSADAQQLVEPGGRPEDAKLANSDPNEFAWQLFLFLNHQARQGVAGVADSSKTSIRDYDADRAVVWETWGLASGLVVRNGAGGLSYVDNKSEVFKRPATQPVEWDKLDRGGSKQPLTANLQGVFPALNVSVLAKQDGVRLEAAPFGEPGGDEEVRMNRSTYDTVRSKRLYSVEGLEAAANAAKASGLRAVVAFEPASKEVKAQWVRLSTCQADAPCADKDRYHWRIIVNPTTNAREVWGLASLHIITKDLQNWFWADFGHLDCESGTGACGSGGADPGNVLRDSTTNGPGGIGPSGSNGVRAETLNSKWQNYRLRGTQINFVTPEGLPTILSNPVIENSFQKSSCMTCHSLATVGVRGTVPNSATSMPFFLKLDFARNIGSSPPPRPDIGAPVCAKFYNKPSGACPDDQSSDQVLYFQTDFLWSLPFRAFSEK
jgi:hypothetical protein